MSNRFGCTRRPEASPADSITRALRGSLHVRTDRFGECSKSLRSILNPHLTPLPPMDDL